MLSIAYGGSPSVVVRDLDPTWMLGGRTKWANDGGPSMGSRGAVYRGSTKMLRGPF